MESDKRSLQVQSFTLILTLLFILALLIGCAGMHVRPPDLSLQKIGLDRVDISGAKINVHFDLINVNPHPIVVRGMDYRLAVNGKKIGKGYVTETLKLGEMERQSVVSTLDISFFKLPAAVKAVFREKTVHARVEGNFTIMKGRSRKVLPFEAESDIPIKQ